MFRTAGLAALLLSATANAYTLDLTCGSDGSVTAYGISGNYIDLATRLKLIDYKENVDSINKPSLPNCPFQQGNSSIDKSSGEGLLLVSEFNSRATNKSSRYYDREQIKEIIDLAVRGGIDPYAALAIVLVEKPPIRPKPGVLETYSRNYGILPLDAVAIVDALGCRFIKGKKDLSPSEGITDADFQKHSATFQILGEINSQMRELGQQVRGLSDIERNGARGADDAVRT